MGLSDYEQGVLKGLEQDLDKDDPTFGRNFTRSSMLSRRTLFGILIFIAGIIILLIGVSNNIIVGILGFLVMFLGAWRAIPTFHRMR